MKKWKIRSYNYFLSLIAYTFVKKPIFFFWLSSMSIYVGYYKKHSIRDTWIKWKSSVYCQIVRLG